MLGIAVLRVQTYIGLVAGACHYIGSVTFKDTQEKVDVTHAMSRSEAVAENKWYRSLGSNFRVKPGDMTDGYLDLDCLKDDAIQVAKERGARVLLLSDVPYLPSDNDVLEPIWAADEGLYRRLLAIWKADGQKDWTPEIGEKWLSALRDGESHG